MLEANDNNRQKIDEAICPDSLSCKAQGCADSECVCFKCCLNTDCAGLTVLGYKAAFLEYTIITQSLPSSVKSETYSVPSSISKSPS